MNYAEPRRPRGGFTLMELLVAMVVGSLLMIVVFQMLSGQSRVVAAQSAREEAQQNVRGALEVVASELRGAIPGAILSAEAQAVTFMQPRMWGFTCPNNAGNTVTALFPATAVVDLAIPSAGTGVMVNTAPIGNTPAWAPATSAPVDVTQLQVSNADADCTNQTPGGNYVMYDISAPNIGTLGATGNSTVVLYTTTRYELGQADGATWLMRSTGTAAAQPLAGPVESNRVSFTYYNAAGAELTPAQATATPANIRMVRVQVVTNSTQKLNTVTQRDSGAVTITLRNAQ